MQEIDVLLDDHPELSPEMVTNDIRNQQAHSELVSYNDHRVFAFVHPFTQERRFYNEQLSELFQLKQSDPDAFITEAANITQNIRRIESKIRTNKFKSPDELQSWQDNLARSQLRKKIITTIISK